MNRYYLVEMIPVLFWGASYMATAVAYETTGPLQLGMIRAVLAAALFFGFRLLTSKRDSIAARDLPRTALAGLFGGTLYFACQNTGLAMTSSSNAALITSSYPAIIFVMECLYRRRIPPFRQIAGVLIAIGGVLLLTGLGASASEKSGAGSLLGDILLISAGVMWGFYCLINQKLSERYSPSLLTGWQMLFGAVFFVPFVIGEGHAWIMPTARSLSAVLFLSVGCSLLSFLAYNYALTGISVTAAATLLNLQPVVGVLCSWAFLGETVTLRQIAGGAVIVAGVWLSSSSGEKLKK